MANACSLFGAVGCIADDFKETAPLLAGGVGSFRHRLCSLVRAQSGGARFLKAYPLGHRVLAQGILL